MKKAGDLLASFFDREIYSTARKYSELFDFWKTISGETLSSHSRIRDLDKTILIIEADHPGWIQILQTKQSRLLEGVRRRFPDLNITGMAFYLTKDTEKKRGGPPHHPGASNIEKAEPETKKSVSVPDTETSDFFGTIRDEKFKETLRRLERGIIARNDRAR